MNAQVFLSTSENLTAIREVVLQIQSNLAPEEVEVTKSYVTPLIELAARGELPEAAASQPGAFGAANWMLPSIVLLVIGMLQTRLTAGTGREVWGTITEVEVRDWVYRSGSVRARKLIPELAQSLQKAFCEHLAGRFEAAEAHEERHTDVSCPGQVWKETARFSLVVRLTVGLAPWSAVKSTLKVEPGKTIRVNLQTSPAFEILTSPWQEIDIPPGQDSAPAVFDLRPRETGPQSIGLDFYQTGHHLGTVRVPVEVVDRPTPEAQMQAHVTVLPPTPRVPPPDRILRITWHRNADGSSLALTLIQEGGTAWWDLPSWRIERDPAAWAKELFQELNNLSELSRGSARDLEGVRGFPPAPDIEGALMRLGQNLWRELPGELRSLYMRARESWQSGSLLILSDEPFVPWELLWPYGEGGDDPGPWGLTLRLSRWLARGAHGDGNSGAPGILPLTAVACLAPSDSHLPAAGEEKIFLQNLFGPRGIQDVSPAVPSLGAVMDLLRANRYDWLHATSHGKFSTGGAADRSALLVEGRQGLTPQHFVGAKIEDGLRRNRPAFVFNVCHAGRLGWGLTGLAGWADRLISCGAGLFLGPLWKVEDKTALLIARTFYEHLLRGETVAEAARQARLAAQRAGNPTWLAYSLYAHPNARVCLPEKAPGGC